MLINGTVAFCLTLSFYLCLFYGAISGDDYIFSDNSDPLKEK